MVLALFFAATAAAAPPHAPPPGPAVVHGSAGRVSVGVAPPVLTADRLQGPDPADLSQLSGRVVILDFWATWCGPCQAIMPILDALSTQYHDRGLSVVGISAEPRGTIERHLRSRPVGYTIARDQGPTSLRFGVSSVPMLVVVGRDGKVREVFVGVNGPRMRHLVDMIPALLDEPTP